MSERHRIMMAGALAVACVGVAVFVASRGKRLEQAAAEGFEDRRTQARASVDRATYSPLESSSTTVNAMANQIAASSGGDESAARRAEALRAAHQFLINRFVPSDGSEANARYEEIAHRMVVRGASIKESPQMRPGATLASMYQYIVGEPLPPDLDPIAACVRMMEYQDQRDGGSTVPTGISLDPGSISVAVGRSSLANPGWPYPEGPTNDALMYADVAMTHQTLWNFPDSLAEQNRERGGALVAQVQFFLEFGGGVRQPVAILLVWSPSLGEWMVDSTVVGSETKSESEWTIWMY